jgi:cell division protein FtsA
VYENGVPLLVSIIKAGGEQITSDIALGLRVPVDIAEEIKHGNNDTDYSKRRYEEIVEARVSDMAMKITDELARIMRAELLPAGVVLLGGTSLLTKIEYYFRFDLKLPIGNALRNLRASEKFYVDDIKYARVYGLTFFAESISEGGLYMSLLKRGFAKTSNFIKRFLP